MKEFSSNNQLCSKMTRNAIKGNFYLFSNEGFSQNGGKECDEENFHRVNVEERSCSTGSCKSKGRGKNVFLNEWNFPFIH